MQIPSDYLSWLKRPSLEIVVVVSLAYGGPAPLGKKLVVPPEYSHEALSFYRHLIRDYRESSGKSGLRATSPGDAVEWDCSVSLVDLLSYSEKCLKEDHHPGWQRTFKFCEQWHAHCPGAKDRMKRQRKSTTDIDTIRDQLDCVREAVLALGYDLPVPKGKRTQCAREVAGLKRRVSDWGKESLKDLFAGSHAVANRLVEKHGYYPWWRGLEPLRAKTIVKRSSSGAIR
jgi:hypothetical protein